MKNGQDPTTIRGYLQRVADEFKSANKAVRTEAVLEREDAGGSFETDLVRAKFRVRKALDLNAVGLIVTADEDDAAPDVPPSDVARAILNRLDTMEETRRGSFTRLRYAETPLIEIIDAIG